MDDAAPTVVDETPADEPSAPPRISRWLGASLLLSLVSISAPHPVLPLVAGVLAFVGYGEVRKSGGRVRGPGLARVAMSTALVLTVLTAWVSWDRAPMAAAMTHVQQGVAAVDRELRDGTAETIAALVDPPAGAEAVEALRAAGAALGPLEELGPLTEAGGWDRTQGFLEGPSVTLDLGLEFRAARFRHGTGVVTVHVEIVREDRTVRSRLTTVTVVPAE